MENLLIHIFNKGTMMTSKSAVAVKIPVEAKKEQKKDDPGAQAALRADLGAKYFFFSSRSLKTREKCISFAQFVYF